MNASEESRQILYDLNRQRLAELAFRAIQRGRKNDEIMIVCIDVDDPVWSFLVDELMPGYDWQSIRDRGEKPVARGSVSAIMAELLSDFVPNLAQALVGPPPSGHVRVAVLGAGGASIYLTVPQAETETSARNFA